MLSIKFSTPQFTEADAERLSEEYFGLPVSACSLPSERDRNFFLKCAGGREYILRIANVEENPETLEFQNLALGHLANHAPDVGIQRLCPAIDGRKIIRVNGRDGSQHMVRVMTWIPGRLLAQTNPQTPELLRSLGGVLGMIDRAFLGFDHPAAHRDLKWDLRKAGWIRDYLDYLDQPERRTIVENFLRQFEERVLPALPNLRAGVIYNDANDYNLLVDSDRSSGLAAPDRVVGVVDFGDALYSNLICEPAIASAYAMIDKVDPLDAAAKIVAGYHEQLPLTEAELETLFPLICTRLCVSVVNSAYQQVAEPENRYLLISQKPAWALLEKLNGIHPQFAHGVFRHACGLPASPKSRAIVEWLAGNSDRIGRLVEPELSNHDVVTFDLSVGSLEISNPAETAGVEQFSETLFSRIRAAGARVGIGCYDEARALYTSDIFKTKGNDGPEWRSVHLGLDLFIDAGSPVFAPLDGTIHSFRNNAGHLDYGPTIILEHRLDEAGLGFFTLYGHLSAESLDGLYEGKPIKKGERLASIGNYPVNGNWPPHLHFQIMTDLLGIKHDFPGVAIASRRDIWLSICPDPNLIARIPAQTRAERVPCIDEILKSRSEHIGRNLSVSYRRPLKIVRGWMQFLYDEDGRAYLDAVNNVPHVGHCHPRVVEAGQRQMAVLNTNTRYLHDNLIRYAERLCATLPEKLSVCFFVNSGSEANELALRLARTHTGSKETIVVDAGYHGNTTSLIEISPYKHDGPGGSGPPPFVHKVPMPDLYRGAYQKGDPMAGVKYARHAAEMIETIESRGERVGAFICESILSCGGQVVLPPGYLQEVYRQVRRAGGVCIADEVQTGFGRAGSHFHAFETQGVIPDIVTFGKPIGNGHPLAAVVTTPEIAASFNNGMEYFNTFGGNPVSCAIGLAVLEVIADEKLQENALETGAELLEGLRQLADEHRLVGEARGLGLFVGIELVRNRETREPAEKEAAYIANRMRERAILLSTDGPFHNVLKIKPPMTFNRRDADFLLDTLDQVLRESPLSI